MSFTNLVTVCVGDAEDTPTRSGPLDISRIWRWTVAICWSRSLMARSMGSPRLKRIVMAEFPASVFYRQQRDQPDRPRHNQWSRRRRADARVANNLIPARQVRL